MANNTCFEYDASNEYGFGECCDTLGMTPKPFWWFIIITVPIELALVLLKEDERGAIGERNSKRENFIFTALTCIAVGALIFKFIMPAISDSADPLCEGWFHCYQAFVFSFVNSAAPLTCLTLWIRIMFKRHFALVLRFIRAWLTNFLISPFLYDRLERTFDVFLRGLQLHFDRNATKLHRRLFVGSPHPQKASDSTKTLTAMTAASEESSDLGEYHKSSNEHDDSESVSSEEETMSLNRPFSDSPESEPFARLVHILRFPLRASQNLVLRTEARVFERYDGEEDDMVEKGKVGTIPAFEHYFALVIICLCGGLTHVLPGLLAYFYVFVPVTAMLFISHGLRLGPFKDHIILWIISVIPLSILGSFGQVALCVLFPLYMFVLLVGIVVLRVLWTIVVLLRMGLSILCAFLRMIWRVPILLVYAIMRWHMRRIVSKTTYTNNRNAHAHAQELEEKSEQAKKSLLQSESSLLEDLHRFVRNELNELASDPTKWFSPPGQREALRAQRTTFQDTFERRIHEAVQIIMDSHIFEPILWESLPSAESPILDPFESLTAKMLAGLLFKVEFDVLWRDMLALFRELQTIKAQTKYAAEIRQRLDYINRMLDGEQILLEDLRNELLSEKSGWDLQRTQRYEDAGISRVEPLQWQPHMFSRFRTQLDEVADENSCFIRGFEPLHLGLRRPSMISQTSSKVILQGYQRKGPYLREKMARPERRIAEESSLHSMEALQEEKRREYYKNRLKKMLNKLKELVLFDALGKPVVFGTAFTIAVFSMAANYSILLYSGAPYYMVPWIEFQSRNSKDLVFCYIGDLEEMALDYSLFGIVDILEFLTGMLLSAMFWLRFVFILYLHPDLVAENQEEGIFEAAEFA